MPLHRRALAHFQWAISPFGVRFPLCRGPLGPGLPALPGAARARVCQNPPMVQFPRNEIDEQFAHLYFTGCVAEDWLGWADLFTDDCRYVEHFWGTLHGRAQVRAWIDPVMCG